MHKFDSYINTIISGLGISKKKKGEIADEFKDHLESLKSEFMNNGFSESESIIKAIERFGVPEDINKKLRMSLFSFRRKYNVVFGVVITFVMLIMGYIPFCGVLIAYRDYSNVIDVSSMFSTYKWVTVYFILLFVPIGYFLPIIINRSYKAVQLALAFSVIGIFLIICLDIITFSVLGSLGTLTGYVLLIAVNRLNMVKA